MENRTNALLLLFLLSGILAAASSGEPQQVNGAAESLCSSIKGLLPIAAMLLLIAAGPLGVAGLALLAVWYLKWRSSSPAPAYAKFALPISALLMFGPMILAVLCLLIVVIAPSIVSSLYPGLSPDAC